MDARPAVAKEAAAKWLGETFTIPLSLRSEVSTPQREQRAKDIHSAIHDSLPAGRDRLDLLALCEAARVQLIRDSKAATWPTPNEVVAALGSEVKGKAGATGDGWPHQNSEYVIGRTARWVGKFDDWPRWLTYEREVADELIARGDFTADELGRAGYGIQRVDSC